MRRNYTNLLRPIRYCGLECALCKVQLETTDLAVECPDCAAIFCEECVLDGFYTTHNCEEYVHEEYDAITWREDDVILFQEGFWCD